MNEYLFLAFSFVWLIFFAYVWSLSRRRQRLQKELANLQAKIREVEKPHPQA